MQSFHRGEHVTRQCDGVFLRVQQYWFRSLVILA